MRDVIARNRINAIEGFEEDPILAEVRRDLVEARLRVTREAKGELAFVVAHVRKVETRRSFERRLAALVALFCKRDREHRIPHGGTFAQSGAFQISACEVHA